MLDLVNFAIGCVVNFVLGLAAHSIYLHEKKRHGWKFPWDHSNTSQEGD